jgi:hypothetical protein
MSYKYRYLRCPSNQLIFFSCTEETPNFHGAGIPDSFPGAQDPRLGRVRMPCQNFNIGVEFICDIISFIWHKSDAIHAKMIELSSELKHKHEQQHIPESKEKVEYLHQGITAMLERIKKEANKAALIATADSSADTDVMESRVRTKDSLLHLLGTIEVWAHCIFVTEMREMGYRPHSGQARAPGGDRGNIE